MKKNSVRLTALILALVLSLSLALTGCGSKSTSLKIAVPNDTTNEARALLLLQENGIIKLRDGAGITATKNDIVENPYSVEIVEAEAARLPDMLKDAVLEVLQQHDNKYLTWFLDKVLFTKYTAHLYQMLAGFATDMSADKNPVPGYRNMLEEYEAFKQKVFDLLGVKLDSADFAQEYAQVTGVAMLQRRHPGPEG